MVGKGVLPYVLAKHVELYLNGEYLGLYLLSDQTDENKGRTGVKEDFAPDAAQVPFLVEWDEYAEKEGIENTDWFKIVNSDTNSTEFFNVKYPEADERYSSSQFNYVKDYVTQVNALCHNRQTTRAQFEEKVDLTAFIDYYLVQELMGQMEINKKSVYMSKKPNGKLIMGPVWDFDWSAGGPMTWQNGKESPTLGLKSSTNWFGCMLKKEWFKQAVKDRLEEKESAIRGVLNELKAYKMTLTPAAVRNASMWDYAADNPKVPSFSEYYDFVLSYIEERIWFIPYMFQYIS